jgi:hypothetical protein
MRINKKRIIAIGTMTGILVISSQTNAVADFEKVINTNHANFGVETTFNQQNTTGGALSEGYLNISMKFSNIRPRFNPYIVDEEFGFECVGEQSPQWDTYYGLSHSIEIVSTDYIVGGGDSSRSGRIIRILTNVKLSQNGVPLFNSSNPNTEILFTELNPQGSIDKESNLSDYFSLQGQELVSKPFTFPVYAGEEFIITHSTYAVQNFKCPQINTSGAHKMGKDLESTFSLKIEKKVQKITAQIPTEIALVEKIERIVYSSSSKLPVTAIEKSPKVCVVDRDIVYLKSKGDCIIEFSQIGDKFFFPAETVVKKLRVVSEPAPKLISITCVKGKLIKKVTAVKPVCPKGYKKK